MSPNISTESTCEQMKDQSEDNRKEILYNGYFYDVTEFIGKHPGGTVIKFYTDPGEDATQAIEQFHYRSRNKVELILKSFKKRPAEPHERSVEPKSLLRHERLSRDFQKLYNDLEAEGYFEPSIPNASTTLHRMLSTIFCGFALSRLGWLTHEGGHNSLTGRPKLDKFIQAMCFCFTMGASSTWWNAQHNKHHAMPQRLEHDVDLATLPFVAFHRKTVTNSTKINTFFIKYQAVLYWTIDIFLTMLLWRLYLHPRYQLRKTLYAEMLLGIPSLLFCIFAVGPGYAALTWYWMGFFLLINFALNHSHLDVADKPTHWVEYSLTHTANIRPSIFVDYYMGYLNYQIEHHLFPTMPQFRHKEISHRVKVLAEKHGLPYRVFSYFEACKLALQNLNDVGRELTKN